MGRFGRATSALARSFLLRWLSDRHLVALARRGNRAAYEVLIDRYRPRLIDLCTHVLPPGEDVQDAVEEVVAVAHAAMLAEPGPINPRPWLYRIARSHALNHRLPTSGRPTDPRRSHRTASAEGDMRVPPVLQDVGLLSEAQRTALFLRGTEGLSYEQSRRPWRRPFHPSSSISCAHGWLLQMPPSSEARRRGARSPLRKLSALGAKRDDPRAHADGEPRPRRYRPRRHPKRLRPGRGTADFRSGEWSSVALNPLVEAGPLTRMRGPISKWRRSIAAGQAPPTPPGLTSRR